MQLNKQKYAHAVRETQQFVSELHASRLRRGGVALVCAYVLLVPLVFDYSADLPFVVPKAILSHGLAYVLAAVLLGLLARFGLRVIPSTWLHVPVLAFLGINVLATVFAVDTGLGLYGSHARMLGLGTIAAWTVLYFAVALLVRSRADVVALSVAGLASVAFTLLYEVVQVLGADPFDWNLDVATRPISTNGQPTTLGTYLTIAALAVFAAALTANVVRVVRVTLGVVAVTIFAGAAATATRSVLIGLASGGVFLLVMLWLRNASGRLRVLAAIGAGIAAVVMSAVLVLTPVGSRIFASPPSDGAATGAETSGLDVVSLDASPVLASLDARVLLYRVAMDAVRERPLLGYGPDNFVVAMTRHRPETGLDLLRLSYPTSAHSWIAATAVGSGVLGLVAFVTIAIGALLLALRHRTSTTAFVGGVVVAAFLGGGLTTVSDIGSDWVFWIATGLMAAASSPRVDSVLETNVRSSRPRTARTSGVRPSQVITAVLLVVSLALLLAGQNAAQASRDARQSGLSRLQGRADVALQRGVSSIRSDAGRPEYWRQLGLAYVSGARWRDAAAAFERAHTLAPWDARYIVDLIQTQLLLMRDGDAPARTRALQLAAEILAVDPNYPDALYARAQVLQATDNNEAALQSVARAIALAPQARTPQWYLMASQLHLALGHVAEALSVAQRGYALQPRPDLGLALARALMASGDFQSALAQVDSVLADQPGNASALQLRAQIQAAMTR
jgi:O-antigen ligase